MPEPEPPADPSSSRRPSPDPDQEGVAGFVRALASRPGCAACIVADATLYAAEQCEQLLGAPEVVISHCKAALPSTVGEVAACVGEPPPCCAGRGPPVLRCGCVVARHVAGTAPTSARCGLSSSSRRRKRRQSTATTTMAPAEAPPAAAPTLVPVAARPGRGQCGRGWGGRGWGGRGWGVEAGAAEARRGEPSMRPEARLEAGRRRLVVAGEGAGAPAGLPPPARPRRVRRSRSGRPGRRRRLGRLGRALRRRW